MKTLLSRDRSGREATLLKADQTDQSSRQQPLCISRQRCLSHASSSKEHELPHVVAVTVDRTVVQGLTLAALNVKAAAEAAEAPQMKESRFSCTACNRLTCFQRCRTEL